MALRRTPRSRSGPFAAWLWVLILVTGVSSAKAQSLTLRWNDCSAGAGAAQDRVFECNTNLGDHDLVASFVLGAALDSVIGLEAVLDMQHGDVSLPDWWMLDSGGCRAGAVTVDPTVPGTVCADTWGSVGIGLLQDFQVGQPQGGASQARMKLVVAVSPSDSARSLFGTVEYLAARVRLTSEKTIGLGVCEGCGGSACLVLNSILVRRLPGGTGDLLIEQPLSAGSNHVTWQGSGTSCEPVPIRQSTWGAVKNLYR